MVNPRILSTKVKGFSRQWSRKNSNDQFLSCEFQSEFTCVMVISRLLYLYSVQVPYHSCLFSYLYSLFLSWRLWYMEQICWVLNLFHVLLITDPSSNNKSCRYRRFSSHFLCFAASVATQHAPRINTVKNVPCTAAELRDARLGPLKPEELLVAIHLLEFAKDPNDSTFFALWLTAQSLMDLTSWRYEITFI